MLEQVRKLRLDVFFLPSTQAALAWAEGHTETALVFEETLMGRFTLYCVAVNPRPGVIKFTRANV